MYPAKFDYVRAESLSQALELLAEHGGEARPLAGGMSLIPLMKLRLAQPRWIVDIGRLPDMSSIARANGAITLGAMVRHAQALESPILQEYLPIVTDAIETIGDVQVRNWGTAGGALAQADPSGDWGPLLLALNGRVRCQNVSGQRWVDAQDLFINAFTTSLKPDELITEIELPIPDPKAGGVYLKLGPRTGAYSTVTVAIQLSLDESGICRHVGIAMGAAGLTPIKARQAEALLQGQSLTQELLEDAAEAVQQVADPISDTRGTAEYKRDMLRVLFNRGVDMAVRRNRGEAVEAGHV